MSSEHNHKTYKVMGEKWLLMSTGDRGWQTWCPVNEMRMDMWFGASFTLTKDIVTVCYSQSESADVCHALPEKRSQKTIDQKLLMCM